MDLKVYYDDMHIKAAELEKKYPDGVVYVTSLFYRERNSTPGRTLSATIRNASRVITDGTHREATREEVDSFLAYQQEELQRNSLAEQAMKKQYFVVLPSEQPHPVLPPSLKPAVAKLPGKATQE